MKNALNTEKLEIVYFETKELGVTRVNYANIKYNVKFDICVLHRA